MLSEDYYKGDGIFKKIKKLIKWSVIVAGIILALIIEVLIVKWLIE